MKYDLKNCKNGEAGVYPTTVDISVNDGIITEAGVSGDFFSASDIDIADLLKGVRYTPDDVKKALAVLDGALFAATADDLTRGIFE